MGKRGFVRGLFGDLSPQLKSEIEFLLEGPGSQYAHPFVALVFGRKNFDFLSEYGVDCRLLSPDAWVYPEAAGRGSKFGNKYVSMHKLMAYRQAFDEFDEFVWLDWDCVPVRRLPQTFWEILGNRRSVQAPLYYWPLPRWGHYATTGWVARGIWVPQYCLRPISVYPLPNGGFVYLRDAAVADRLLKLARNIPDDFRLADEAALAIYIDRFTSGWQGLSWYFENFEPAFCDGCVEGTGFRLSSAMALYGERKQLRGFKDIRYWHFAGESTERGYTALMKAASPSPKPATLDRSPLSKRLRRCIQPAVF